MKCKLEMLKAGETLVPRTCPTCNIGQCVKGLVIEDTVPSFMTPSVTNSDTGIKTEFELWRVNRPHWTDSFYEAYCAGRIDEKCSK